MKILSFDNYIPLNQTCLIEASAGTGKTFSITNIFLHAILSGIPIEKILVLTYTEAATKELRSRIRENLTAAMIWSAGADADENADEAFANVFSMSGKTGRDKQKTLLETAIINIDQSSIFTVHSFCQRMLTENAFESKIAYGAELICDSGEIAREMAENFWRANLLNISESEKELFKDLKFDDFLGLTKELIKFHDVKIVNNKLEAPPDLHLIEDEYRELSAKVADLTENLDLDKLKADVSLLFKEIEGNCLAAYKGDKLLKKLNDSMRSLEFLDRATGLKSFTYENLTSSLLSKAALKEGVAVPQNELSDLLEKLHPLLEHKIAKKKELDEKTPDETEVARLELLNKLYSYIQEAFPSIKNERQILTFDDLLLRLRDALRKEGENGSLTNLIREKYKLVLVDEFQDTDNIQYEIFKHLFESPTGSHGFFMIGDPKQSIYKFRNADIFSYLSAKSDARERYTLNRNYRSEKNMVAAVNELFSFKGAAEVFAFPPEDGKPGITYENVESGAEKAEFITTEGQGNPLQFWFVDGFDAKFAERNVSLCVASEIIRLMELSYRGNAYFDNEDKRPLRLGDIAILVNTNKQAAMLKDILSKSEIPAVIQNSLKIFDSREAREIQLWVKALIKPVESNIRALFVTNLLGRSAEEIALITDLDLLRLTEELTLLKRLWSNNGFFSVFLHFITRHKVREKALSKINGERVLTNYIHLAELLHKDELQSGKSIEKTLTYLEDMIAESASEDEFVQRLESDRNAVKIMTIHKSKGLEFPVVFCPFIWSNAINKAETKQKVFLFNAESDGQYLQTLDFGAKKEIRAGNIVFARRETLAEHIRLIYVATTRSANRCYLPVALVPETTRSALVYLFSQKGLEEATHNVPKDRRTSCVPGWLSELEAGIKRFVESSPHASLVDKGEGGAASFLPAHSMDSVTDDLNTLEFPKRRLYKWGVTSFSDLTESHPFRGEKTERGEGIFSLPKGKTFGTAVHKVFQNYFTFGRDDFNLNKIKYFQTPLKADAFFRSEDNEIRSERFAIAEQMFSNVLDRSIDLDGGKLILADISAGNVKTEFSFFYKINHISPKKLMGVFASHGVAEVKDFAEELGDLKFSVRKGYMNGEIDLFFRHEDKYYLLDWKTNHLGPEAGNYGLPELRKNMSEHCYFLQYHIYTLAAHMFLSQQLSDYDYESRFGGVLYVYTRGVDDTGNGIFYNKPSKELIEALEKTLCGAKDASCAGNKEIFS